jgi:hypothetical protein
VAGVIEEDKRVESEIQTSSITIFKINSVNLLAPHAKYELLRFSSNIQTANRQFHTADILFS